MAACCTSPVDRSDVCLRCGVRGHKSAVCTAEALRCTLCTEAGRPADHRVGGTGCHSPVVPGVRGRAGAAATAAAVATTEAASAVATTSAAPAPEEDRMDAT